MMATRLVALVPTVTLAVVFEASQTFDRVAQVCVTNTHGAQHRQAKARWSASPCC